MLSDRYRKEDEIGHGGMGVVYKAFDTVAKRFVALKTLKGEVDGAALELFQREWSVLAQLSHPNIVDVLDIGNYTENGHKKPYFVMPLLPGCTLNDLIINFGSRLTVERVVEIICQASRGLQAAHDRGLVHRDLKPSNLFVLSDDTVKIIDFGIVHLADHESRTSIKGTLQYMAPEQLEMKPASARSDIYSLGVVCYQALTGRKPFDRTTEEEVIEAIRSHMPTPVSDLNSSINDQVSRAVHKAMAKQPYHRFSSVREFSDMLQRAQRNEHIEIFDRARIQPRITRINRALNEGDHQLALDILDELQSEGNIDTELNVLRLRAEQSTRSKAIYQLIESARTRMEEEEYPLALQNIQRVLDIDPGNIDALALKNDVEHKRGAAQIGNWLQIARQHLDNKLFAKARQAVDEVLRINSSDRLARELLNEIATREQEMAKLRQEKQQLYDSALKSYRNGEISSALKKLEQVVDLGKRAPGHPNTDAQYIAFFEEVRTERDELHRLYTEGKQAVASRDFARALHICSDVLHRRPREPLFKALKIETEDLQRQENSASIAQLYSQIESEADLDRKFALLKTAVKQFPDEQMFANSSKSVKERRDLVNSIVSRARLYESQSNYPEALNQWDILRSVYPQYPGLDFEIQRLSRKQEMHVEEEANARWVQNIDSALFAGDFTRAEELVRAALSESPEDGELLRLQQQVSESSQRNTSALSLLHQGNELLQAGNQTGAIEKFRDARSLNGDSSVIASALSSALVGYSKSLAEREWRAALPFVEEALEIDPTDAGAASVSRLVDDMRKREQIERYLVDARDLQTQQKLADALGKAEQGSREFPGDIRLAQLKNTLRAALATPMADNGKQTEPSYVVPERARSAAASAVSSGPATKGFTELFGEVGNRPGKVEDPFMATDHFPGANGLDATIISPTPLRMDEEQYAPPVAGRGTRRDSSQSSRKFIFVFGGAAILCLLVLWIFLRTNHTTRPAPTDEGKAIPPSSTSTPTSPQSAPDPPQTNNQPDVKGTQPPPPSARKTFAKFSVEFESTPPRARVTVDGELGSVCLTPCPLAVSRGSHNAVISLPGFSPVERMIQVPEETSLAVTLREEPMQVRLTSNPPGAAITVDGEAKGVCPITLALSLGSHKVGLSKDNVTAEKAIEVTPTSFSFILPLGTEQQQPPGGDVRLR